MMASQITILDEMFDLDLALTIPDDAPINKLVQLDDQSKAARNLLCQMPTVVTAEGGDHCAVCTEGFRLGGPAKRIPCGHVFHENCISRWLSINDSCPLCRHNLFAK